MLEFARTERDKTCDMSDTSTVYQNETQKKKEQKELAASIMETFLDRHLRTARFPEHQGRE